MANLDYDTKINSKPYRFFDLVYRLIIINVMTVILSGTVVCLYPAVIAAYATIKEGAVSNVFKQFFKNFAHFFKKSFGIGIIVLLLYAVNCYAIYFYATSEIKGETDNLLMLFLNAGFLINFVAFFIITFLVGHLPLLIITFEKLTVGELLRTSLYVTFRYILTTLVLLVFNVIIFGTFVLCLINPGILAIWLLVGITLPIFLSIKVSAPIYYKFSKIDFEKIMHRIEEEEKEENKNEK